MAEWLSRLGVWTVKKFAHTGMATRRRCAAVIGWIFWLAVPKRRHIILTNLKLCFPEKTEAERRRIAHAVCRNLARTMLDHGVCWAGTEEEVARLVKFEGLERVTSEENRPMILLSAHFMGLDCVGIAFNLHVSGIGLYTVQRNRVWDRAALEGRLRFRRPVMIPKGHGSDIRQVIRAMREGHPFYYFPDMDYGSHGAIFVPFFGVPAATLPVASKLARVTKAKVCLCIAEMTDEGYTAHVSPLWEDFPTGDLRADTERVTREIEGWIRKFPDQYLWTHRRFKTRPEGEPPVY